MEHRYSVSLEWIGNTGGGTSGYKDYDRAYRVDARGKPSILGSSDPNFLGDRACWNPEELLLASIAACHQLWYLHLCADAAVVVLAYSDRAEGVMIENPNGGGRFSEAILRPEVTIATGSDIDLALRLHGSANEKCFVANSLNFPVRHDPVVSFA
jgi:organic hydroperoxide reductase OsmC/OhrA